MTGRTSCSDWGIKKINQSDKQNYYKIQQKNVKSSIDRSVPLNLEANLHNKPNKIQENM